MRQVGRSVSRQLQPDSGAAIPAAELVANRVQEVFGFLLVDVQVPVPRDAKSGGLLDGVSGKEIARESGDDVFQQGKGLTGGRRNPHEPLQDRRHLDDREAGVSRILSAAPALLPQEHRDVNRLVPQMWEGMSWVDGQRSERRKDVLGEVSARCRPLLRVERIGRDEVQSVPLQARENVGRPDPMLLFHHGVNVRADRRELLVRQEAVGSRLAHTPELLLL